MKSFKIVFVVLICFGCKNASEDNSLLPIETLEEEPIIPQKVWLKGRSDDSQALNYFNLQDEANLIPINHYDKKKVYGDSLELVLDSIVSSRFLEIAASGENALYKAQIFIIPGDTVLFEIKNKQIKFHGKNAKLNNFYSELYGNTTMYYSNPYKGNLYAYKRSVDSIYKEKLDFFNTYIKKLNISTENFIAIVKGDLKHEHLAELMSPRYKDPIYVDFHPVLSDMYGSERDGLMHLIIDEYGYGEKAFDFKYYFNAVTLEDFKDSSLLENGIYFRRNINQFVRYYFDSSSADLFSEEKLKSEKKFIEKNFDGEIKRYAIANMIRDYERKGFGYSKENIKVLKSIIDEYDGEFIDQSYKDEMAKIKESLDAFNFQLPNSALNSTKLLSLTGDTLTLNDIFKRSSKRIRVIDFWASWCGPCIDEIKKEKDFKDKLAIEKNVEWIYLSIDKDIESWKKSSSELSEFLNVRNQYLILGGKNTSLGKALKVEYIPRYVIFNTKNEIVLDNAPRPSDTLTFKKIIHDISLRR